MKKLLWPMLLLGFPFAAVAQAEQENDGEREGPLRWGLGVGVMVNDSPYAGEGARVMPVPLVSYHGERFYFEGISAGWKFINSDALELSALVKPRFDGFDVDDLGRRELALNGIDRGLLEDRDKALDVGLDMKWKGRAGQLDLELLADATDKSGGQEASINYSYSFELGNGVLTPNVGVTWQSKDMANYYYGTLDEEVARGVVDYKPGAITMPYVGVNYYRPLGEKWSLLGFARYSSLPDEIKDSPLIERDTDGTASVFIGFTRGF